MKLLRIYLPISLLILQIDHKVLCQEYQHENAFYEQKKRWAELTSPIHFTRSGVQRFLEDIFNRTEYLDEVMPHSFCHLIQFLEYGKTSKQDIAYMESSLRLFLNKLKQVRYVSPESASLLLERLPLLLRDHFTDESESLLETTKKQVKRILYDMFLTHFSFFKQEPDKFFDKTCEEIVTTLHEKNGTTPIVKEQCRQLTIRFLEMMLNKLIWDVSDQADIWLSFKALSNQLAFCENEKLINRDELDDLLHSLLERFVYFLELRGAELNKAVIETIKSDISSGKLCIAHIEEQEEYLTSKITRLEQIVMETEAKILAREKGIITDIG